MKCLYLSCLDVPDWVCISRDQTNFTSSQTYLYKLLKQRLNGLIYQVSESVILSNATISFHFFLKLKLYPSMVDMYLNGL